MIRILGNNLANKKKIYIGLTSIYGIGISRSKSILKELNINPDLKIFNLTEKEIFNLRNKLENSEFKLEGDLRRYISLNIKRLININCFRGRRHLKGLPSRGQRTRTNSRTVRRSLKIFIYKK